MIKRKNTTEKLIHYLFLVLGIISVCLVGLITIYLIASGMPAIKEIGVKEFILGRTWKSTGHSPSYGIYPFIITSFYGIIGATILGVPIGILTSVFISKVAGERSKIIIKEIVNLLATIPSVVYGLVGMIILVPCIRKIFHLKDGACLLAAIIVLAIMILPSIIKVSVSALESVPSEYEEGALALGACPFETYFTISLRVAKSGIITGIILGIGRAIGETMAVMMVAGNVANMPKLFRSVRFLTTAIASEMSYSSGLQREALFSIALILFIFIMLINGVVRLIMKGKKDE